MYFSNHSSYESTSIPQNFINFILFTITFIYYIIITIIIFHSIFSLITLQNHRRNYELKSLCDNEGFYFFNFFYYLFIYLFFA